MEAILFWHGQFVSASANSFKYWRGWVSDVDGGWHFYYQFGRMSSYAKAGSSRVGCKRMESEGQALLMLRDKVRGKTGKGYAGLWYYPEALVEVDFPLDVACLDWQLPQWKVTPMKATAKPKQKSVAAVRSDDDALVERRSPLNIGWRLDL